MTAPANPFDLVVLEARLQDASTPDEQVTALADLGYAYGALGQPERGLPLTRQAYALSQSISDLPRRWRAAYYHAATLFRLSHYAEVQPVMQDALSLAEQHQHLTRQAISLDGLANLSSKLGDLPTALSRYERCLELHRAAGSLDNEASSLGNLSRVYDDMGQVARARELRLQAVTLLRQGARNPLSLPSELNNLGYSCILLRDFGQAAIVLEEALTLTRQLGSAAVEAYILSNLAKLQDGLGRPEDALGFRQAALAQSRAVGDRSLEAELLLRTGQERLKLGALDHARDLLQQALALYDTLGELKGSRESLLALSELAEARGDAGEALRCYRRFRDAERRLLAEEAEQQTRLITARFETRAAQQEAELQRLEKVELARLNEALRATDAERRELLARLEHQAHHDGLTGLGNRRAFDVRLEQVVSAALRHGNSFGVVMLDLDGLKAINDQEGHERGDALLSSFAWALRSSFRHEDGVYRLGGDEYALILERAEPGGAGAVMQQVARAVGQTQAAGFLEMDASAGAAYFPRDAVDGAALVRRADEQMYAQKQQRQRAGSRRAR